MKLSPALARYSPFLFQRSSALYFLLFFRFTFIVESSFGSGPRFSEQLPAHGVGAVKIYECEQYERKGSHTVFGAGGYDANQTNLTTIYRRRSCSS